MVRCKCINNRWGGLSKSAARFLSLIHRTFWAYSTQFINWWFRAATALNVDFRGIFKSATEVCDHLVNFIVGEDEFFVVELAEIAAYQKDDRLAAQTRTVSSKPPSKGTVIVRNRFFGSFTNSK